MLFYSNQLILICVFPVTLFSSVFFFLIQKNIADVITFFFQTSAFIYPCVCACITVPVPNVSQCQLKCPHPSLPFVWQVATFILQKILLDDTGLAYICQTYERFSHVAMILVSVLRNIKLPFWGSLWHWAQRSQRHIHFVFSYREKWCSSFLKNLQLACWSTLSAATFASQTISGRGAFTDAMYCMSSHFLTLLFVDW